MEGDAEAAEAVAHVLRARDHYEALGATRDADTAELRRCYLRASVRVHPDKNGHPDATSAFQRLASAWAVLGDEAARQRYDVDLRDGRTAGAGHPEDDAGQAASGLDESFAAFAFAAAACAAAGGGSAGDFAEVLLCAEGLAHMHETGQVPDGRALVGGGLALSAGLRMVGAVAHGAGLEGVGAAAERTASAVRCASELAAVGAVAAQLPAVQEALESGRSAAKEALESGRAVAVERAQQLGVAVDGARTAVRERAEQLGAGEAVAQVGTVLGGVASWAQRARQRLAESFADDPSSEAKPIQSDVAGAPTELAAPQPDLGGDGGTSHAAAQPGPGTFQVGAVVRLQGLQAAADLNGRLGEVVGFDESTARYRVQLLAEESGDRGGASGSEGSVKRVRPENIVLEPRD